MAGQQIGWSMINTTNNTEVLFWGDVEGVMLGVPDFIKFPNGDTINGGFKPGMVYKTWTIVPRNLVFGTPNSIVCDGVTVTVTRPQAIPNITKVQLVLWMLANTTKTEADIQAKIDLMGNPQLKAIAQCEWNYRPVFTRANAIWPLVKLAFNQTDAQIDAIMIAASQL